MPSTTLYDSDCGFCRWLPAKVLAWGRRGALRPVALESEEADRLLAGMPKEGSDGVVAPGGPRLRGQLSRSRFSHSGNPC